MITINNLIKDIGTLRLFEIKKLVIDDNDKIAIIGDNGVGKTTLLKIIAKLDDEFEGDINVKSKVCYIDFNKTYNEKLSPGERYQKILNNTLSFDDTFLLLDEPTSHLDYNSMGLLTNKLNKRKKGYIIISHDRDFINKTADKIIEIVGREVLLYNGNYNTYLEEKEKLYKFSSKEYENYKKEINRLNKIAVELSERSKNINTTPKRMGNSEARLHKMGGQINKKKVDKKVKSVKSRIDHMEIKEKPKDPINIKLQIPEENNIHSKILIESNNLNKSYGKKAIFKKANFFIENKEKVALIGKNGSGKTTLLNMILKNENINSHPRLNIGYFSQLSETLDPYKSIIDNIKDTSIYDETMNRIILGRLNIRKDEIYKKVNILSDGQRSKVKLVKMLTSGFNILIFDEPTNFLDINTINALEEMLDSYEGSIIFVSHDRDFVNNLADRLLIIENKKIISFKGNLSDYENKESIKNDDDLLIDFKISSILSELSLDISNSKREDLNKEYDRLMKIKNKDK